MKLACLVDARSQNGTIGRRLSPTALIGTALGSFVVDMKVPADTKAGV